MILCPNSGNWCNDYELVKEKLKCDCIYQNECRHKFREVKTYRGSVKEENVIDINYQCVICGKFIAKKEVIEK